MTAQVVDLERGSARRTNGSGAPPEDDYEYTDIDAPDAPPSSLLDRNGHAQEAPAQGLPLVTLASLVGPALDRAERRRNGEEVPVPVPFPAYAAALGGGFWPGAHFIVSGTGVGKSQLTIQTALGAARAGIPCAYIGLELDEAQIALRVLGEHAGLRWSNLYLGRVSSGDLASARDAASGLDALPLYCDFGPARGWPASRLALLAEQLRKMHPSGPLLLVLDYLQLVGDDVNAFDRRPDTREKIGGAAYAARDVARRYDASVVVVSSAARAHYGLLASDAKEAGLATRRTPNGLGTERAILHPHTLIGLGKESGEVEFSADTVSVLIRWPGQLESGETPIVLAVPKVRYGVPSWLALRFWGRFEELPIQSTDDLPEVITGRGGKGQPVSASMLEARVLDTIRKHPGLKSKTAVAQLTTGTKSDLLGAVAKLLEQGRIAIGSSGFELREDTNR